MPSTPKNLGKFTLVRELGRGGMGVVYEAVDGELQRRVALKLLLSNDFSDEQEQAVEIERFIREAQLSAKLKHPHIVIVYEAGAIDGRRYLSMQLVEGTSLAAWLKKEPLTGLRARISVLRDVALAVDHAHRHGILHRDLKPQNVLMDREGQPYVSDFGLAKRIGKDATASLTVSGSVVGTPSYMSPEQARGLKSVDGRTDVYALGVILYEMLADRTPFQGDTPLDVLMKVVKGPLVPPSTASKRWEDSAANDAIENICLKAMARDPRARYPTAGALAEDLGRWLKGERTTAAPAKAPASLAWLWISIGAAAVLAAGAVYLFSGSPDPEPAARKPAKKADPDPEVARLAREKQEAIERAQKIEREASREREENLLREAGRLKRDEEEAKKAKDEKAADAERTRQLEARAAAAEEAARKAKETPVVKAPEPEAPKPVERPDAPVLPAPKPAPAAPRKTPEPAPADQKAAEKAVQARFKDEYLKKLPAERRTLAAKLLELGLQEADDAAAKFALLQEARELAAQNGGAETALGALEGLTRVYAVDAKVLRAQTLAALAKAAIVPASMKDAGAAGLKMAADASAEDDYDSAASLLSAADALAKRSKDAGLAAQVQDRTRELAEIRKEWPHVRSSFKVLQDKPDDPAANLAAGRFLCFTKLDWEKGNACLARGSDEALKAAAAREIAAGVQPDALADAAGAWSALPEKQAGARSRISEHVLALYRKAWPGLGGAGRDAARAKFRAASTRPGRPLAALPALWTPYTDSVKDPFFVDDTLSHGGRLSLKVAPSPKPGLLHQWIRNLKPGRTYTLSAWVYCDGSEPFDQFLQASVPAPSGVVNYTIAAPGDQPWWTFVQKTFTPAADATLMVIYVAYGFKSGAIWIDDVSCKLDDGTELLENTGFEQTSK